MKLDFVSDIACPWCAVGFWSLDLALARLPASVLVSWHARPFELNPQMGAEGEDLMSHLARKYGAPTQQLEASQQMLRQRGAEVGFAFGTRDRIWNTFDAHRLLYWAGEQHPGTRQKALKRALLQSYHGRAENPNDRQVLVRCVQEVGLPADDAKDVLESTRYAEAVRQEESHYQQLGVRSVPTLIIDDRYAVNGSQTPAAYESILRQHLGLAASA